MADASKKHMGAGPQGKGAGVGGLTVVPPEKIGENMVLSNRDKRGTEQRGADGKGTQNDQWQDHEGNRQ